MQCLLVVSIYIWIRTGFDLMPLHERPDGRMYWKAQDKQKAPVVRRCRRAIKLIWAIHRKRAWMMIMPHWLLAEVIPDHEHNLLRKAWHTLGQRLSWNVPQMWKQWSQVYQMSTLQRRTRRLWAWRMPWSFMSDARIIETKKAPEGAYPYAWPFAWYEHWYFLLTQC